MSALTPGTIYTAKQTDNTSKLCKNCDTEKNTSEFNRLASAKDGLNYKCRSCVSAYKKTPCAVAARRKLESGDKYRAVKKKYRQSKKAKEAAKEYRKTAEYKASKKRYRKSSKGHAVIREYESTENGKAKKKISREAYNNKYPKRVKANKALTTAVSRGKIVKPLDCSECGLECLTQGHHDDYNEPLDVRWLCPQCHKDWHNVNGPGLNGH